MSGQPSVSAVTESTREKSSSPSGRLLLRMPPGLHAELTRAAEREGSSLNGYIIARLTESVGWVSGDESTHSSEPSRRATVTWLLAANVAAVTLASAAAIVILLVAWLA